MQHYYHFNLKHLHSHSLPSLKKCIEASVNRLTFRSDLYRQNVGRTLPPPIQQEAHGRTQVLQIQVRQEAPLELHLHAVAAGAPAALQEHTSGLTEQPISQLLHARAVTIGQRLPAPDAEM